MAKNHKKTQCTQKENLNMAQESQKPYLPRKKAFEGGT